MKQILLIALLLSGLMPAVTQVKKEDLATKNTKSPGAETSVTINGKNLWIYYHAPSVRGRHIFNGRGRAPAGWQRMASGRRLRHCSAHRRRPRPEWPRHSQGATTPCTPTSTTASGSLIVNKTLMAAPATSGAWAYHRTAFARGATTDDPATELGRASLTMGKPSSPVETLKITLSGAGGAKGKLLIELGECDASAPSP